MRIKSCILCLLCLCLCACGAKQQTFNLEKEGTIYNYSDTILFYYPRDWKLKRDDLKLSCDIINEDSKEALFFDVFMSEDRNTPDQLIEIYEAKLKDIGVVVDDVSAVQLKNGQAAYFVTGINELSDTYFCEVVLYLGDKQYIYSYIATEDLYYENVDSMKEFLFSISVNEAQKVMS